MTSGPYRVSPEELKAIDEALEQVARGERASAPEIAAAFARFHNEDSLQSAHRVKT
jgi:hypothetical protein